MNSTIHPPRRPEVAIANHTPRPMPVADPNGILPIDKPSGMTSHDVVDSIRRLYGTRRVGHTGTLDSAASGLLLLALGGATRVTSFLTAHAKTYLATIRFGAVSDTGDGDGDIVSRPDAVLPDDDGLAKLMAVLVGSISQEVPDYAAVRINGRHRYELARRGQELPTVRRTVTIHDLALIQYTAPDAQMRVRCSAGTYIRSLATELGESAGCGAYLATLRREEIGHCHVSEAFTLETLTRLAADSMPLPQPRPIEDFLDLPGLTVTPEGLQRVAHGQSIRASDISMIDGQFMAGDPVVMRDPAGQIAALGSAQFNSDDWPNGLVTNTVPLFRYQRVLI